MFKDDMTGVSTLSFSLCSSVKDMIQQNSFEVVTSDKVQFISDKGDIYIPYSRKYGPNESGDLRMPTFAPGGNAREVKFGNPYHFQDFKSDYVDRHITTITYDKSISLPALLEQLASDPKTYGVVIQTEVGRDHLSINPLHPMVAFMVASNIYELPEEGKLHIFEYKNSKVDGANPTNNASTARMESYISEYEKFFAMSKDIIRTPVTIKQKATISDRGLDLVLGDPFVENLENISVDVRKDSNGAEDLGMIKTIVVPNQLVMDGTVCPYYGISAVTEPTNSNMRGFSLGPMSTGNINASHSGGSKTYKEYMNSGGTSNVCTGSQSSSVPKGWFTLSKVNLSSMYYSDIIDKDEVFPFIQAAKKISGDVWKMIKENKAAALAEALEETEEA